MPVLATPNPPERNAAAKSVVNIPWRGVFDASTGGNARDEPYLRIDRWASPVTYFVGRNGTGKSRAAKALASHVGGRLLTTDRLLSLTGAQSLGYTILPNDYKGVPLGDSEASQIRSFASQARYKGAFEAVETLYSLRQDPEVLLRVAAFIRRALGRAIELRERSGFLDPYIQMGNVSYSLFRDEGHGLRELVILLAAVYRTDWTVLVVDEPELHLHPAMARLWVGELDKECRRTGRHAVVVTHEPALLRPKSADDLEAIWLFTVGRAPIRLADEVLPVQRDRVTASLGENGEIVAKLVFSPRPVLVEGVHDVAALTAALRRTHPPEVVAQTDLVACGGSGAVALWFEIATRMHLDVRAVADLDACLAPEVTRTMDSLERVRVRYAEDLAAEPANTAAVLRPLISAMNKDGVGNDPKSRAKWLAGAVWSGGSAVRKDRLVEIWRSAGMWLHPQGTLEDVLGIESKGEALAREAAAKTGPIDDVAAWCAYQLDPTGEVFTLLSAMIERIAHDIIEAVRLAPDAKFTQFFGPTAESDSRLAEIAPVEGGKHRLTVRTPIEFAGYWVTFSRDTRPSDIVLSPPNARSVSETGPPGDQVWSDLGSGPPDGLPRTR
ncbi:AAA family ATPase [Actinoplanes sp. NPDC049316]|uniref:ATP-dependent nuclease n=1 Tax=Actinoplanes sp. NPDC049316 TaxID=3154727 RepID=UPI00342A31F4